MSIETEIYAFLCGTALTTIVAALSAYRCYVLLGLVCGFSFTLLFAKLFGA